MSLAPGTSRRTSTPSRAAAAGYHTDAYVARGRQIVDRDVVLLRKWGSATRLPDVGKRVHQFADRGAPKLDAGIAPRFHLPRGIALPFRADAKPRHESDASVDDDRLAVIARQPAERAVEARSVEHAHVNAGGGQDRWQRADVPRAQPVVDDVDGDTGARLGGEHVGKGAPDLVVIDDVTLELDRSRGAPDRRVPRRKVFAGVEQQLYRIPVDRSGACGAREGAFGARGIGHSIGRGS